METVIKNSSTFSVFFFLINELHVKFGSNIYKVKQFLLFMASQYPAKHKVHFFKKLKYFHMQIVCIHQHLNE